MDPSNDPPNLTPIRSTTNPRSIHRRAVPGPLDAGVGTLALASLLDPRLLRRPDSVASRPATAGRAWSARSTSPPRPSGSSICTWPAARRTWRRFDYKPDAGQDARPADARVVHQGQPIAQLQGQKLICFAPQHPFRRCGQSGQEISAIFPHLATVADEHLHHPLDGDRGDQPRPGPHLHEHRHDHLRPAGDGLVAHLRPGQRERRPAGFVVLTSTGQFGQAQPIASRQWHSGFLPSRFQGVRFRSKGDPVLYLGRPHGHDRRPPARRGRRRPAAQPARERGGRRPRDRHADQPPTRRPSGCRPASPS